ncbi:BKACE family enzyme [Sneathiella aquimaris]|uniref:3-keto-5-aminohexanoate cleavage protein n=1 Tax=Sneathiella aquimaris TaxID=2599305 RepID=UPI00146F9055|nr:3-keto-5-aminohexanoate cleavage protein [Sneathiella aquimaris]
MNDLLSNVPPLIITVAPNGARKTREDHPALPITPEQLAEEALLCKQAGASMIHLHVRDDADRHSLDVGRYRAATDAIRARCGEDLIIQATTEAVGQYTASEQMAVVRELQPQAASLAIRELVQEGDLGEATEFFHELTHMKIMPHYILYSEEDLQWFQTLVEQGVIPEKNIFLLFVLGRYSAGQVSSPQDLLPFLTSLNMQVPWSVCAFGPMEHAAASAAVAMGGHVRVGFENNMRLKNGQLADRNSDLVRQIADVSTSVGRPIATAEQLQAIVRAG